MAFYYLHVQVQFVIILLHVSRSLYANCDFDLRVQWALVIYMISHLLLFFHFYIHSYIKPASRAAGVKGQGSEGSKVNVTPAVNGTVKNSREEDLEHSTENIAENKKDI